MNTRYLLQCALAASLAACGGTLGSTGDAGTDTATDVTGDTGTDTATDVTADTDDDMDTDVPVDTATDVDTDTGCTPFDARCISDGAQLEVCNGSGTWDVVDCRFGCDTAPDPHCRTWAISNLPDPGLLTAGALPEDLTLPDTGNYWLDLDTDTGEIALYDADTWAFMETVRPEGVGLDTASGIHFAIVSQGEGHPFLGVFSFQELVVPANYGLGAAGLNALVLVSELSATIDGGVFVGCTMWAGASYGGGSGSSEGPGAGTDGTSAPTGTGGNYDGGGGGAGYGGGGGDGAGTPAIFGAHGTPYGAPGLVPLTGGSGGGNGAGSAGGRAGGFGGGAVMIVSGNVLAVSATGWIDAGGCGGQGAADNEGGGGGGSGGAILLEAPEVHVAGWLTANGGGGAGGGAGGPGGGTSGEDGHLMDDTAAAGGLAGGYGCEGGDGNPGEPDVGQTAPSPPGCYNYGGGGGGGGRIRVNGNTRTYDGDVSPHTGTPSFSEADLVIS